ncbi:MAG: GNAT family N-acetyltransferase [Plesiomonas shigelloides]
MEYRPCTIDEVFASGLFDAYAAESAIKTLPAPNPQQMIYEAMTGSGVMACFGAFDGHKMVGLLLLLTVTNPHYNKIMSTTESLYVAEEYRRTGAGLKLMKMAEQWAKNAGSAGIFISAPVGGKLAQVMKTGKLGYVPSNEVFFKCLT